MKHLKKSMFFSTILMVVILIAALSTATFAWFTSNSNATSKAVQVGTAEATSYNIGIGFMKGATANTINFLDLVNSTNNKGDLDPTIPVKYYDQLNDSSVISVNYTSSTKVPTAGYVEGGMYSADEHSGATYEEFKANQIAAEQSYTGIGIDYKRIVNMNYYEKDSIQRHQVEDIVAASDYIHDFDNGILTNLTGIGADYEQIYTIRKYAYNDSNTVSEGVNPANRVIKVSSFGVYTIINADFDPCYKVVKAFEVDNDAGTEYVDFDFATTTKITMSCAYYLSGNNWFAAEGGYVVAYDVYAKAGYKADVKEINSDAKFVGYAANNAGALNAGDILASTVKGDDYPGVTDILYNYNDFAYVAKTYAGSAIDDGSLSNKKTVGQTTTISYEDFKFNKCSIDGAGYFQDDADKTANIAKKYSGTNPYASGALKDDIAVLQGRDSRNMAVETFYVTNNASSGTDPIPLSVSLTTDGDNGALLRVALFMNGTYVGTLAGEEGAATTFGTIYAGAASKDLPTYSAHSSYALGTLAPGNSNAAEFQAVVWFDGKLLDDAQASRNASFILSFHAE